MKVDLERLRRDAATRERGGYYAANVTTGEVLALVAVVDAAREFVGRTGPGDEFRCLRAALEPFAPRYDETSTLPPAPWAPPNSRDWVRDQLANAGVMVQRQFRSDQERIAELEARLARVPALVWAVRRFVDADGDYASLVDALAEWHKP